MNSTHNHMYLWFHSDASVNGDGFKLRWESAEPGEEARVWSGAWWGRVGWRVERWCRIELQSKETGLKLRCESAEPGEGAGINRGGTARPGLAGRGSVVG